jgi:hypothetical protein
MGIATSIIAGSLVTMGVASATAATKALHTDPKNEKAQAEEQARINTETDRINSELAEKERLEQEAEEKRLKAEEEERIRLAEEEAAREEARIKREAEFEKPRGLTFGSSGINSGFLF